MPLRYLALVVVLIGIALIPVVLAPVLNVILVGFLVAFLLFIPIRLMMRYTGMRQVRATLLAYLVLVVLIAVVVFSMADRMIDRFDEFVTTIQQQAQALESELAKITESTSFQDFVREVDLPQLVQEGISTARQLGLNTLKGAGGFIATVGSGLFFSFLLMLNLASARGHLAGWLEEPHEREVGFLLVRLDNIWVGFIVANVVFGTLLGLLSWVQYTLMGVPYATVMAVLTGVLTLIPTIGGLLASLIVAIVCLILGSTVWPDMANWQFALIVLAINVLITQGLYNFVGLPITSRFVKLPVAVVLIGVLTGLAQGSLLIAFLTVPIISTVVTVGAYVLCKVTARDPFPDQALPAAPEPGFFSQLLFQPVQPARHQKT
jgi:predicted PurR-regulated permease PerM